MSKFPRTQALALQARLRRMAHHPQLESEVCPLEFELPADVARRFRAALQWACDFVREVATTSTADPHEEASRAAVRIATRYLERAEDIPEWVGLLLLLERHVDRLVATLEDDTLDGGSVASHDP